MAPLTPLQQRVALQLARAAIAADLTGKRVDPATAAALTGIVAGAFVSLHAGGDLRGCIGQIEASHPVAEVIAHCAEAAAFSDPRFAPVTLAELGGLVIEISILGPLVPVGGPEEIVVGRDGVVVEQGHARGLLLPQVATEHGWDAVTLVGQTCRKAGLPTDAWRRGARLHRFEAQVFGETDKAG